jgi:type I restriction enzyme S subunit
MNEINNIPKHWEIKKLREVCKELQSGKRPKGGVQGIESGIPSLGAEHLNFNGGFKFQKIKFVPKEFAEQMKRGIICKDDIIIVKDGATTGKTSFVTSDFPFEFAVINEHVFIVRLKDEVLPKYAFYKLFSSIGFKEILEDFRGAAQGGISSGFLDKVNIPIPPLPEQQAILDKIEELLSELENGKQQLLTAQQQLKVYRQSLLKWAFEGKLTNNNVKDGELPKGWKMTKLGDYIESINSGKSYRCDERPPNKDEVGIIKVSSVTWGFFDEMESKTCFSKDLYNANYLIKKGDFLFSRANTIEFIGACVIVKKVDKTLMLSDKILRFTFSQDVLKEYALYYLRSRKGRKQIETLSNGNQDSMRNIGQEKIRQIEFPYCTIKEQQLIISELESKLTVCDKIEETISQSLQQAETLRQSILKKAFEGKLITTEIMEVVK